MLSPKQAAPRKSGKEAKKVVTKGLQADTIGTHHPKPPTNRPRTKTRHQELQSQVRNRKNKVPGSRIEIPGWKEGVSECLYSACHSTRLRLCAIYSYTAVYEGLGVRGVCIMHAI